MTEENVTSLKYSFEFVNTNRFDVRDTARKTLNNLIKYQ